MNAKVLLTPIVKSRIEHMEKIQKMSTELFVKKNEDYDNVFDTFGINGILMKIKDKIQDVVDKNKHSIIFINDESMKNILIDLHNYASIGLMVIDENEKFQIDKN